MALRWMDAFDRYGTPQLPARYPRGAAGASILVAAGRRGTSGALVPGATADVQLALAGTVALVSGCAVWASTVTANTPLMRVRKGVAIQTTLGRTPAGAVFVTRGDLTGPQLGISATGVLAPDTYATLAWQILPDPSVGAAIVVVNGTTVLSVTGVNTAGSTLPGYDDLGMCGDAGAAQRFDDWYVLDATGPAPLNGLLPQDVRVDAVPPMGPGVHQTWAPSSAALTRWQCVDDDGVPNDDADYTATTILGARDSFTHATPVPGARVYGAQVSLVARRVDSSPVPVTIAPLARAFGADVVGSAVPVPTTAIYGYVIAPFAPPDVAQGQAWLSTLECGYLRV